MTEAGGKRIFHSVAAGHEAPRTSTYTEQVERLKMRPKVWLLAAVASFSITSPARAEPPSDEFRRCLETKTTDADRSALTAEVFAAMSANPELEKYTSLSRAERDRINARSAAVFDRLLFADCRKESIAVLKAEGPDAVSQAFDVLGRSVAERMLYSPSATAELIKDDHMDKEKLRALVQEAKRH